MEQRPAIVCRDLVKTYAGKPPVEAVRGIDFTVDAFECFGVLGPNGAGKTTTMEILEGLLPATSGHVEVLGKTWESDESGIRQRIGVSLQDTELSDRLTVAETLSLFGSFYRTGLSEHQAMEMVSLTDKAGSWIKKLSGGQKQRLAVACALVGNPDLLFLDEPTTGLDPASRRQLWEIIRSFRAQRRTVLLTTHYMEEAERLCDRVAIFDQGKVIAMGRPKDLIASLGAEHVIEFSTEPNGAGELDTGWISGLASVDRVDVQEQLVSMTVSEPHVVLPTLLMELARRNERLASLSTRHASLEDVFVRLTGRHLNEE